MRGKREKHKEQPNFVTFRVFPTNESCDFSAKLGNKRLYAKMAAMNHFMPGQFSGETYQTTRFDGITATETEYSYNFIDWHYHENSYFSLTTFGNCRETNKRETFECLADTLLFNNCQEPHRNAKSGLTRGFQLEVSQAWRGKFEIDLDKLPPSAKVVNPSAKLLFYNIYKEAKMPDDASNLTIDALLLETFAMMRGVANFSASDKPHWVKKIDEILRDDLSQPFSLQKLSVELNLHAAHLSREFSRYFRCNFGEYIRKVRVEKSVALLRSKKLSLTDIANICGFADQSHFIRCFKEFNGLTPKAFRKIISSR